MNARAATRIIALSGFALWVTACATPPAGDGAPTARVANIFRMPAREAPPETATPPSVGASEASLRAEYGEPDFVRDETESELWRYDGEACALFLFLYREDGALKMRHAETNPAGEGGAMDADCLLSVKRSAAPLS